MAITQAELENVITLRKTFNGITGQLTIVDISNYPTYLTLTSPYTIKGILKVLDSADDIIYENAGYATDSFASPDITWSSDVTQAVTMNDDAEGNPLTGTYTIFYKVQVIEDVGGANTTTNATHTEYPVYSIEGCPEITPDIAVTTNCNAALVKLTDETSYGSYTSLSRTFELIPPPLSGQSTESTSATTIIYSATPYTGTWSWSLECSVTYYNGDNVYVVVEVSGEDEFVVKCDTNFCQLLCLVLKYYAQVYGAFGRTPNTVEQQKFQLVLDEFTIAYHMMLCGKSDTLIQEHIDKIYSITGYSEDCGCGCDESPTPILPTTTINGEDGTDGTDGVTPMFRVSGGYVQVSTDNGATWTNLYSLASVTGSNGTNGTDGTDGTTVLSNSISDSATAGTSWETLKTYTVLGSQLATDGSYICINAMFKKSGDSDDQEWRITFDGTTMVSQTFPALMENVTQFEVNLYINRTSSSAYKYYWEVCTNTGTSLHQTIYRQTLPWTAGAGVDWTTTKVINAQGNSVVIGDVICENLTVTYFQK